MTRFTPEQVDTIEPSMDITDPATGDNCPNFFRHLYFSRFCLGEDWLTCFQIAALFQRSPLTLKAMHLILGDWKDEGWGRYDTQADKGA